MPDDTGNPSVDFHGEKRSNETDVSTTDAEAKLATKAAARRRDLKEEKTGRFESTDTWRTIKRVYAQRMKSDPPYARVPEVTLKSQKLTSERSTSWFAKNVVLRSPALPRSASSAIETFSLTAKPSSVVPSSRDAAERRCSANEPSTA